MSNAGRSEVASYNDMGRITDDPPARREGKVSMIAWGGYDESKPRVRLLLDALRRANSLRAEINIAAWRHVEDKSVAGPKQFLKAALALLLGYPAAIMRLARAPKRGVLLLPYPGIPDIFVVALAARLFGHRVVLDAFLPLHDTIVRDRAMLGERSLLARLVWAVERAGLGLADIILVDTDQHGDFFASEFGIDRNRFVTILVGAEPLFGEPTASVPALPVPSGRPLILFYGQMIPLHGLATILQAARLTEGEPFHWLLVGRGQDEPLLREALGDGSLSNVSWLPWVDYESLPALIRRADLCLGIFGGSDKASRVIPNKMFQVLAAGKPLLTRSSPAVAALAAKYPASIVTVSPADPRALADAVRQALRTPEALKPLPARAIETLGPKQGVEELLRRLGS